jgi:hypothetical protein
MRNQRLTIDQLVVDTFVMGRRPDLSLVRAGPAGPGSSGGGCTVLTTCSDECCDTTIAGTGD